MYHNIKDYWSLNDCLDDCCNCDGVPILTPQEEVSYFIGDRIPGKTKVQISCTKCKRKTSIDTVVNTGIEWNKTIREIYSKK